MSERRDLGGAGAQSPCEALGVDGRFAHTRAEVVSGALRKYVTIDGSSFVAHAARQIAQPQAEACVIQITHDGPRHDRFELPHVGKLTSLVSEVLPGRVPRADRARDMD